MRHKRVGRKLGVVTKHRRAMFRNMATDLFRHESITTTDTSAKEIRRVAEKMITLAKKGTLQARRQAAAFIKDKDVLKKLFSELAEKYKDRPGGYTRIIKMGYRKGDNAPLSLIEIVQEDFKPKKKKKIVTKAAPKNIDTKKSTKKESAEELGLIEDTAKAAVTADTVSEEAVEPKEEVNTETEAKEAEPVTETPDEPVETEAKEAEPVTETPDEPVETEAKEAEPVAETPDEPVETEAKTEEPVEQAEETQPEAVETENEAVEEVKASSEDAQNEKPSEAEGTTSEKAPADETPDEEKE